MNNKRKTKRRLGDQPRPVIERWWRLKGRKWAQELARTYMRWKLPHTERERRAALKSAFETVKTVAMEHENGNFKGLSILTNIGLYLLIADRDIQAAKIDALTHPDEWTRKLNARIILLTIYEWDADKVSGRELRKALDIMLIPDDLKREAIEALRELRAVQRKITMNFSLVRNTTIAHRNPNALAQYRAIRDLKVEDVMAICIEFFSAIDQFVVILTRLLLAGNTLPALLNQYSVATMEQPAAAPKPDD